MIKIYIEYKDDECIWKTLDVCQHLDICEKCINPVYPKSPIGKACLEDFHNDLEQHLEDLKSDYNMCCCRPMIRD